MRIESRFEAIQEAIQNNPDAGEEAEAELRELMLEYRRIAERGFQQHLKSMIEERAERYQDEEIEDAPPVCTCTNPGCDFKLGDVPAGITLKMRDPGIHGDGTTAKEATEEYMFEEGHNAEFLEEALDTWNERLVEIEQDAINLQMRVQAEEAENDTR